MQVVTVRYIGIIIDFFVKGGGSTEYLTLFMIFFASRIFLTLGRVGWRITMARQTHHAAFLLKTRIWDNACFFPKKDLDQKYTKGVLMNINTSDVRAAKFLYGFTMVGAFDMLFLGGLSLQAMFSINVQIALASLLGLVFIPYVVKKLAHLEMRRYRVAQEYLSKFNDISSQMVSTIRMQRLTQTGPYWEERLKLSAWEYRNKKVAAINTSLQYVPTMGGASVISYLILFSFGIKLTFDGAISVGDFVAMQGLVFLVQGPLMSIGFIISDWKRGSASLERICAVYNAKQDEVLHTVGKKINIQHPIVLSGQNLKFKYPTSSKYLLKDINISLSRGDRLGIIGPIGSGKSTLVNILAGLERNHSGEMSFLGQGFNNFSHRDLRNHISMVPQKSFLFADTIRKNLCLDRSFSDEQIWHYLKMAAVDEDVKKFSDGLDSPLGEWGINLSGGQKQRLTLARALMRKPQLLFLDDCISAVDIKTEEKILKNLDQELSTATLVWVAHRKSTLRHCNQMLELQ
ncbi:MAG: ABC transporter ATP-binding protein [Bacteriovoracaceae bacterium]|nr:ABC transporter ATP-binding protein [Bacteriovoracaceae bacterium]